MATAKEDEHTTTRQHVFIGKGPKDGEQGLRWQLAVQFMICNMKRCDDIRNADFALLDPCEKDCHVIPPGAQVVGAAAALSCQRNKRELPRTGQPIFSFKFHSLIVCCTGLDEDGKADIRAMVRSMGGVYANDLEWRSPPTHLVAGAVGSEKYRAARILGVPIVSVDWVRDSFFKSTCQDIVKYLLPVLQGLVVAVSDLERAEREEVEKIVKQHGGRYTKDLSKCNTHLICPKIANKTAKCQAAARLGVKLVSISWLRDCTSDRGAKSEEHYDVSFQGSQRHSGTALGEGKGEEAQIQVTSTRARKQSVASMTAGELFGESILPGVKSHNSACSNKVRRRVDADTERPRSIFDEMGSLYGATALRNQCTLYDSPSVGALKHPDQIKRDKAVAQKQGGVMVHVDQELVVEETCDSWETYESNSAFQDGPMQIKMLVPPRGPNDQILHASPTKRQCSERSDGKNANALADDTEMGGPPIVATTDTAQPSESLEEHGKEAWFML